MRSVVSQLHLKFAQKTWNDTSQLVRRCMEKPRDESKPCEPLVRSLERLQEVLNVSSVFATRSRLEMIAKRQGMGFHVTDATCYLTADLFYLEVVLLPCGGVEEVKVAPHGGTAVPSERLLQLLRLKNFADFSIKLADLFSRYNIPGDNEVKLKVFTSLQCLGKDLEQLSHLPRVPKDCDSQMDAVNNGRIGCVVAGKEDYPVTIQFYIAPSDVKATSFSQATGVDAVVQTAQVTVAVSNVAHRLQMASVIPQPPQLDAQGYPVFLAVNEVPHETLPACFLLRLQPAVPVMVPVVKSLSQITDVIIPHVDLQWAPLPKLLKRGSLSTNGHEETFDEPDAVFSVSPAGVMHSYILPGAAWEASDQRGMLMDSVPFTHPAQVPAILELLRQQCALNTLLRSCTASQHVGSASACDLHCEVLPQSGTSFSVTFQQPNADTLTVLLVKVLDARQIECSLFGAGAECPSVDDYVSTVMKMCMSVPATLGRLFSKLAEIASAPLSSDRVASTEAEHGRSSASSAAVADANSSSTTFSQRAAVPQGGVAVSASSCIMSVPKSERLPEINLSPDASSYPFGPVDVFSHWMAIDSVTSVFCRMLTCF